MARSQSKLEDAKTTKAREGANVILIIGCDFHPGFQQVAIFDNQGRFYRRLAVRKHRALAKVAVARKLAMKLYLMLREDGDYAQLCKTMCRQA